MTATADPIGTTPLGTEPLDGAQLDTLVRALRTVLADEQILTAKKIGRAHV